MIADLTDFVLELVDSIGYVGIFITMFIESGVFPPIPSDIVLGTVGLLVYEGELSYFPAVLAAALGNMFGTLFLYMIGSYGGRPFLNKYGYLFFYDEDKMKKGEEWFKKYGDGVVFFSQFVPLGRSIISIPAGVLKKNVFKVLVFSFLGSFVWAAFVVFVTSRLGEQWEDLLIWIDRYETIVLAFVGAILALYFGSKLYRWRRNEILKKRGGG